MKSGCFYRHCQCIADKLEGISILDYADRNPDQILGIVFKLFANSLRAFISSSMLVEDDTESRTFDRLKIMNSPRGFSLTARYENKFHNFL